MIKRTSLMTSLFLSSFVLAQTASTTTLQQNLTTKALDKKFGFLADLSFATNFEADGNVDKTYGTALSLNGSYKLPQDFTIKKNVLLEKSFVDDRENKITSGYLGLAKLIHTFSNEITVNAETRYYIPYNADDRDDRGSQGSAYLASTLSIPLKVIGLDPLTFIFRPSLTQSFNEFETDNERNILRQRGFTQTYILDYSISDKLGAGVTFQYIMGQDYRGNRTKDKYLLEESLSYVLAPGFDIYASHGITDESFAPNGVDNNIELTSRDSEVALGFTYTY